MPETGPDSFADHKADAVGQLFGLPAWATLLGAQHVVRTRVHPDHYQTVAYLNDVMSRRGPRFVRGVAEWLGTDTLHDIYAGSTSGTQLLNTYRDAAGSPADLADLFRELAVFAALANHDQLHKLFAAIVAVSTSAAFERRFAGRTALSAEVFWSEVEEMRRQARADAVTGQRPQWVSDVQPFHATVREQSPETNERLATYRLPATIRVFDPVRRLYDIQFHEPREVEHYTVDRHLSIPWERAQTGLHLEIALPAVSGHHRPEQYFLTAAQLTALQQRGSALHTRIGRWDEIRFYPEYLQAVPGESAQIPEHSLVSLRVTPLAVEVQKLDPALRLTVYV